MSERMNIKVPVTIDITSVVAVGPDGERKMYGGRAVVLGVEVINIPCWEKTEESVRKELTRAVRRFAKEQMAA